MEFFGPKRASILADKDTTKMQITGATQTEARHIREIIKSGRTFAHYPKYSIVLQEGNLKELKFNIFTGGKELENGYRKTVNVLL